MALCAAVPPFPAIPCNTLNPSWQFACGDMDVCMLTDSLLGSHPVEVPIINPKEIEQVSSPCRT